MSQESNGYIFRNKNKDLFTSSPIHGEPGWRETTENGLEPMIFWDKSSERVWLTQSRFIERRLEEKSVNKRYYDGHPAELAKKIRNRKSQGYRLLSSRPGYGSAW